MTCTKIEDITHHLTTLPLTLDAHYDEAWERATSGSDLLRSHRAQLILMLTSCAGWLLTKRTLREALSLLGYHAGEEDITDEEIVSSCAGFLAPGQHRAPCSYRVTARLNGVDTVLTRAPMPNAYAEIWRTWMGGNEAISAEAFYDDSTFAHIHQSAVYYLVERRQILFPKSSETIASACLLALTPNEVLCALPLMSALLLE